LMNDCARAPAQNDRVLHVLDFVRAGKRVAITGARNAQDSPIGGEPAVP
jgi:hypothetical protein